MKKLKIFLFIVAFFSLMSCSQEHDNIFQSGVLEMPSPQGKWKLSGYTLTSGKTMDVLLGSRADSYSLTLSKDGTFAGVLSVGSINGVYAINEKIPSLTFALSEKSASALSDKGTKNDALYLQYLLKVKSYRVFYDSKKSEKFLHLYFSDSKENYLEYKESSGLY